MKAWTIYWTEKPKGVDSKIHGATTVVGPDLVASIVLFTDTFPERDVGSISSESDEVLLYVVT